MDPRLIEMIAEQTPKFTDAVVDGIACAHLNQVEQYVDRMFRTAEVDFPPDVRYLGYRRCTPQEEYNSLTRRLTNTQSTLELARSDVYMVEYRFSFKGEELEPRHLYLPFALDAGIIHIRGSVFHIAPVLADKAVSVGTDSIFIPLNRDKLIFERQVHHFYKNGERETPYVIFSQVYHLTEKQRRVGRKRTVSGVTTLAHYLFAKYGFSRTFEEFCNTSVKVGTSEDITEAQYPPDKYYICSSTRLKPKSVKDPYYQSTDLRVAIAKEDYNLTTSSMIGSLFYIADLFPNRVYAEYIDEPRLWMILLGKLLFGDTASEGKLIEDIMAHLKSLDGYVDSEAKNYLKEDNVFVEDIYMLFMHIIETFSYRLTHSTTQVASMYDKRLMVLRYVMKDIVNGINSFMFKITSFKKRELTKSDVVSAMRSHLKTMMIMSINRHHGEVSSVSYSGDNKYFKLTSLLVLQTESSGSKRRSKASTNDQAKFLHCSLAEVGSYNTMSKSEPTGRSKINPCVHITPDGAIERDPAKVELLDGVQRKIQR